MPSWSRPFVGLVVAQSTSRFADAIEQVALGWLAYQLTGSATVMALLLACSGLPNVVFAPFAGVLADRWSKRTLVTLGFAGRATVAALFVAVAITGTMDVVLFTLVFLASTFETLGAPAASATTALVVDRERLAAAAGLSASWQTAAQLVGLATGGAVVSFLGAAGAFALEAAAFVGAAATARFVIDKALAHPQPSEARHSWTRDLGEGLSTVVGDRRLRTVIALALVANFAFAPVNVLQVPFVQSVLGGGPGLLAALGVALAAGMIGGGALVGRVARRWGTWTTVYGAFYGLGGGCLGLALAGVVASPFDAATALLSYAALGVLLPLATAPLTGWLAAEVPLDRQGRVFSTFNALALASAPLGAGATGVVASFVPIPGLFALTGVLVVLATTLARRKGT